MPAARRGEEDREERSSAAAAALGAHHAAAAGGRGHRCCDDRNGNSSNNSTNGNGNTSNSTNHARTMMAPLSQEEREEENGGGGGGTAAPPPPPRRVLTRDYLTGLLFIGLVSVIWAASSVLIQYVYGMDDGGDSTNNNDDSNSNSKFHSPFAVTYIGVALFALFLPAHACLERIGGGGGGVRKERPSNSGGSAGGLQEYQSLVGVVPQGEPQRGNNNATTAGGGEDYYEEDGDDCEGDVLPPEADDGDENLSVTAAAANDDRSAASPAWTHRDHWRAAGQIAPVWFAANWAYNASLARTTVTSSTVLASTGSLFTFGLAVLARDEHFSALKCGGVALGVAGSCLTAWHDAAAAAAASGGDDTVVGGYDDSDDGDDDDDNNTLRRIMRWLVLTATTTAASTNSDGDGDSSLRGDLLGLLSAVGYAAYAVQTRLLCPRDESRYSMQLLLGYIGLWNGAALAPLVLWRLVAGRLRVPLPVLGFLVAKGLLDNVLSDYLWLRAVMLTNATVATVGLGLTIPLAFGSDVLLGKADGVMGAGQVAGALAVLAGFVLVNVGNRDDMVEAAAAVHHRSDPAAVVVVGGEYDDDDGGGGENNNHGDPFRRHEHHYSDDTSEHGQEVVTLRSVT